MYLVGVYRACISLGVHLMGVCLSVYLISVDLMDVYPVGMPFIGRVPYREVCLMGVYLMGRVSPGVRNDRACEFYPITS